MQGIVHVVDDDKSARTAMTRLLRTFGHDVRAYDCGERFVDSTMDRDTAPACILLDLKMLGLDGLDVLASLASSDHPPVVIVSGHGDVASCTKALKGGAIDFLEKPVEADHLQSVVEQAIEQDEERQSLQRQRDKLEQRVESLTRREREVLSHVISGRLNKVIANDFGISEKTVKVHRARVLQKMQVRSIAELARICTLIGIDPAPALGQSIDAQRRTYHATSSPTTSTFSP